MLLKVHLIDTFLCKKEDSKRKNIVLSCETRYYW